MSQSSRGEALPSSASSPSKLSQSPTQSSDSGSSSAPRVATLSHGSSSRILHVQKRNTDHTVRESSEQSSANGSRDSGGCRRGHSGGFLLETVQVDGVDSDRMRKAKHHDPKGKRKEGDTALASGNTSGFRRSVHRPKPFIGSSPLATGLMNATPQEDYGLDGLSSRSSGSLRLPNHSSKPSTYASNSQSLETGHAQIVNLALNLSESRRRQFSIGRISHLDPKGTERTVGTVQTSVGYPSASVVPVGGSLRQHLQQQRRSSRNISPKSGKPDDKGWEDQSHRHHAPEGPGFSVETIDILPLQPSTTTLLRAEKAKQSLELLYEYRRLLQHLPKLPPDQQHTSVSTHGGGALESDLTQTFGRSYNPLQYIRNRKIRSNSGQILDSNADCWKNLHKVRKWVDSVASHHVARLLAPEEKWQLPPFGADLEGPNTEISSPTSGLRRSNNGMGGQSPQGQIEWMTPYWDLLADAYWTEQDDHKQLIGAFDGYQSLPGKHTRQPAPSGSPNTSEQLTGNLSGMTRQIETPTKLDAVIGQPRERTEKQRGRQQHRLKHSINSLHEYSSSQDRKSRWHRRIIRSRSLSSSESSNQDRLSRQSTVRSCYTSKERQDTAVLEKHMMGLLAKDAVNCLNSFGDRHVWSWSDEKKDYNPTIFSENEDRPFPFKSRASLENSRELFAGHSPKNVNTLVKQELNGILQTTPERIPKAAPGSTSPTLRPVPSLTIRPLPHSSSTQYSRNDLLTVNWPSNSKPTPVENAIKQANIMAKSNSLDNLSQLARTGGILDLDRFSTHTEGLSSSQPAEGQEKVLRHQRSDGRFRGHQKESESRLRGFMKGSKFAGIVGNPVSGVRDLFSRKDFNSQANDVAARTTNHLSDRSDTDEDDADNIEGSGSPYTADATNGSVLSKASTNPYPLSHHTAKGLLPKSSLNSETGAERIPYSTYDEIAGPRLPLQKQGQYNPLHQHTLSKLNRRPILPLHLQQPTQKDSGDTSLTIDHRRRPSLPTLERPEKLNHRLPHDPSRLRRANLSPTRLPSVKVQRQSSPAMSEMVERRTWSIPDDSISGIRTNISMRDMSRVEALLLSSTIKAHAIEKRISRTINLETHQQLQHSTNTEVHRDLTVDQHVQAAQQLIIGIDTNMGEVRTAANQLSSATISKLHDQIKFMDEEISSRLTPLVRASADDADVLSNVLLSSCQLDVKRLNDSINIIIRRKRRRFRWVRRGGYWLLERTVVGLMWWVWLIVVVLRLIKGCAMGLFVVFRWLLYL